MKGGASGADLKLKSKHEIDLLDEDNRAFLCNGHYIDIMLTLRGI